MQGKVVVVAGGTGAVGEGIVRAFLAAGAYVLVPARSAAKIDDLRAHLRDDQLERLDAATVDLERDAGEFVRTRALDRHGRLDAVVASLGGWWQGKPLLDIDRETWLRLIDDNLLSHLAAVRAFLPPMVEAGAGSYTLINGGAAQTPVPNAGPMSMLASAQLMLARVLAAESRASGVRVNQLLIETPVATRARRHSEPFWLSADDIGAAAVWLADAAMVNGSIIPLRPKPTRVGKLN